MCLLQMAIELTDEENKVIENKRMKDRSRARDEMCIHVGGVSMRSRV
jgi:hypothetical protein